MKAGDGSKRLIQLGVPTHYVYVGFCIAACGVAVPTYRSADPAKVDCVRCRKTHSFKRGPKVTKRNSTGDKQ